MPRRYGRQGPDWAEAAARGIGGFVEGHSLGLRNRLLVERTRQDQQAHQAKLDAIAVEQARRDALRQSFTRAVTVHKQALEGERTRMTGLPVYERERAMEGLARREQSLNLLGETIAALQFENTGDAKLALDELRRFSQMEVYAEDHALTEAEVVSAIGTEEAPGFLDESEAKFYLEQLRAPPGAAVLSPEQIRKRVEQRRFLKAEQDAKMIGRDEVIAQAQQIRQGIQPTGVKRTNFDRAVSMWNNGLWTKIEPDEYLQLLRVAATVDEPWASLILEPYGLAAPEAAPASPGPAAPRAPQRQPSRVQAILQARQNAPDLETAFQTAGIDPASLSEQEVAELEAALGGG